MEHFSGLILCRPAALRGAARIPSCLTADASHHSSKLPPPALSEQRPIVPLPLEYLNNSGALLRPRLMRVEPATVSPAQCQL